MQTVIALFIITNMWRQAKCSRTNEETDKMWYIYIVEYYTVIKRNELLTYATSQMNLKNPMLSEGRQI